MLIAGALCVVLYLVAAWLARRGAALVAAALIGLSTALAIAAFQVTREAAQGLDLPVVAAFAAYTIPIGLAGVVGSPRLMFAITSLVTLLGVVVGLVLPWSATSHATLLAVVGISLLVHWLVATLVYGASTLYIRTMSELGDIRTALERARQLDQLKDQFITNVNHELRTPIMAMQGYIELLRLRQDAMTADRRAALLDKAGRACDDLVALVSRILDVQRLGQELTSFTPEAVNLRAALEAAIRLIDPREGDLGERELRLRLPAGLAVWGEPVWVRQILTNLLANAAKYSAAGTPVEVTARLEAPPVDAGRGVPLPRPMIEITVCDHGLGVPPEQQALLFNRFARLPRDLASTVIGNGLGLHLCRTLAEAMGGSIQLESTGVPGEGSAFIVRLPADQAAAATTAAAPPTETLAHPTRPPQA
jgi:signal transduction histidine kinase